LVIFFADQCSFLLLPNHCTPEEETDVSKIIVEHLSNSDRSQECDEEVKHALNSAVKKNKGKFFKACL